MRRMLMRGRVPRHPHLRDDVNPGIFHEDPTSLYDAEQDEGSRHHHNSHSRRPTKTTSNNWLRTREDDDSSFSPPLVPELSRTTTSDSHQRMPGLEELAFGSSSRRVVSSSSDSEPDNTTTNSNAKPPETDRHSTDTNHPAPGTKHHHEHMRFGGGGRTVSMPRAPPPTLLSRYEEENYYRDDEQTWEYDQPVTPIPEPYYPEDHHGYNDYDDYRTPRVRSNAYPVVAPPRTIRPYDTEVPVQRRDQQECYVEIQPGTRVLLRRSEETVQAISNDFISPTLCWGCSTDLFCIANAKYVVCPACHTIGPLPSEESSSSMEPYGLGLGLTVQGLFEIQAELLVDQAKQRQKSSQACFQRKKDNREEYYSSTRGYSNNHYY